MYNNYVFVECALQIELITHCMQCKENFTSTIVSQAKYKIATMTVWDLQGRERLAVWHGAGTACNVIVRRYDCFKTAHRVH